MSGELVQIDGSEGEGGGQMLRTALALSMITGLAVEVDHVRAKRSKPGLMRQHLTALKGAAAVCGARVEGAEVGASRVRFEPGEVAAGDYHFAVGTAGSTGLVLQTVLPALMLADKPSTLRLEGGTHNPMCPSTDFLERVFLPQLAKIGPRVTLEVAQHGFYPAGGGMVEVGIEPVARGALRHLQLLERGEEVSREAHALVSRLPAHIARRELARVAELMGWQQDALYAHEVRSPGPGNVVYGVLGFKHVTEMFTAFGARGKHGDQVVDELVSEARAYLSSGAPVGEYLADQLLLPMALAGSGELLISPPSQHTRTQIEMIEKFLEVEITLTREEGEGRAWRLVVSA